MQDKVMKASNLRERRRAFRVTPDPLAVINFPSGNCAVVLDISSNGLGFLAASPLEDVQPRDFRLSFKSIEDAEASGELVWNDSSGKRGGVRFTHLPEAIREQLALWLRQPALQTVIHGEASAEVASRMGEGSEGVFFTRGSAPSLTEPDPLFAEGKAVHLSAIAINILTFALALMVAVGVWSSMYKQEAREAWTRLHDVNLRGLHSLSRVSGWISMPARIRESIARLSYAPPPAPAPPQTSDPALAPPPLAPAKESQAGDTLLAAVPRISASLTKPAAPAKKTLVMLQKKPPQPRPSVEKVSAHVLSANASVGDSPIDGASSDSATALDVKGQAELALARGYLQGDESGQDTAKAVPLLWLAVQKGNSDAEVDLADLYARGAGVPRSCEQARVLLSAADKGANATARKKLSELDDSCR
jgi:hypothetical protein